ncbi:MAG: glycosyltransferase [Patescibacteria group bacterium]
MSKVAAIIPALNEEKTIGGVVRTLKSSPFVHEVIVVSDGSTDHTAQEATAAGADAVQVLSTRGGKGNAMAYGLTRTDAPIIFFADADLKRLNVDHIRAILEPVLEGKRAMNVGLRDRGRFWTWPAKFLPLIGGERALRREVFDNIPGHLRQGFKVEIAMNAYCRANNLSYGYVVMPGIGIVRKMEKFGVLRGFVEYIKMWIAVGKAMFEVRLARHLLRRKT